MKQLVIILGIIIVILLAVILFWKPMPIPNPPSSVVPGVTSSDGTITVTTPSSADALAASPMGIEGSVTGGGWFNEAVFPIKILDGDGTVLGSGQATAVGDWMSTSSVVFAASIPFTTAKYTTGTIEFMNDNPSGNPANAKTFDLEVRFK